MTRASLQKRPEDIAAMFDDVAPKYDVTNDVLSLGQTRRWRKHVVAAVAAVPGQRVLDVAAGTGVSTEPYADAGVGVVAVDFSLGMLMVGKRRRPDIDFVAGDATALPFADDSFDATTISFGLRNIHDPKQALAEMYRVTKPGGRLVVAEFSHPSFGPWRKIYDQYLVRVIPALAQKASSNPEAYDYLAESIQTWPDQDHLAAWLAEAGWCAVSYRNLNGGLVALHRGFKSGPETGATSGAEGLASARRPKG